jgi:hypothetical protein
MNDIYDPERGEALYRQEYPNAAEIDQWINLENDNDHDLTELFNNTDEYHDAFVNYCDDFKYSAEYELAYECWLHAQLDK